MSFFGLSGLALAFTIMLLICGAVVVADAALSRYFKQIDHASFFWIATLVILVFGVIAQAVRVAP